MELNCQVRHGIALRYLVTYAKLAFDYCSFISHLVWTSILCLGLSDTRYQHEMCHTTNEELVSADFLQVSLGDGVISDFKLHPCLF